MSEAPALSGQGAAALAATPAADTPKPAVQPAAPAEGQELSARFQDELDRGYVQNKGWKDDVAMLRSYQALEKMKGVPADRLLKIPEKEDDVEGWNAVWSKLGRPEKPEDYGIDVGDPEYGAHLAKVMHEQNLTKKQAQELIKADNAYRIAQQEAEDKAYQARDMAEIESVKKEWAAGYDANVELGRRFAKQMGLDAETLGKLNIALGSAGLLKFMAKAGQGLGEHEFAGPSGAAKFGMTPEAAKARMKELKGDQEWTSKYLAGGVKEKEEMARLVAFANGQAPG